MASSTGDGTCTNSPDYDFGPFLLQSCTAREEYISGGTACSLTPEDNFFSDPLYDGQKWVYEMINIVPVWEKGYSGKNVRVRINDDGVDKNHKGMFQYICSFFFFSFFILSLLTTSIVAV